MQEQFIIDLERINQLSSHPNDNPNSGMNGFYCYPTTKKLIKDYIEIIHSYNPKNTRNALANEELYNQAFNTLRYNKIILTDSDIRDNKLNKILPNNHITIDENGDLIRA